MNRYELLTIFSATLTDEEKEAVCKKYTDEIEKNNGKLVGINKWGVKKLAYPINYKNEGFYVLYQFEAEAQVAQDIVSLMRIDENVLRQMCLRKN